MDEANSIPVGTLKVKSSQHKGGVLNVPTNETLRFEVAYKSGLVDINGSSVWKKRTSKTMKILVFRLQLGNKSAWPIGQPQKCKSTIFIFPVFPVHMRIFVRNAHFHTKCALRQNRIIYDIITLLSCSPTKFLLHFPEYEHPAELKKKKTCGFNL